MSGLAALSQKQGVTAHGGPRGPSQFDRFGSRPYPPAIIYGASSRVILSAWPSIRYNAAWPEISANLGLKLNA